MIERIGDWIETYTGHMFYPLDPRPQEIFLEDIAHGSSMMCRFGGQCKSFLSIGQHCINVAKEVKRLTIQWDEKNSIKAQALALFHDSSETLGIADICSPAKRFMPEYKAIEEKVQNAVWEAFGLLHTENEYQIVNYVDKAMAAYEAKHLMNCVNWDISGSYLIYVEPDALTHIDLSFRDMKEVEEEFLSMANDLLRKLQAMK